MNSSSRHGVCLCFKLSKCWRQNPRNKSKHIQCEQRLLFNFNPIQWLLVCLFSWIITQRNDAKKTKLYGWIEAIQLNICMECSGCSYFNSFLKLPKQCEWMRVPFFVDCWSWAVECSVNTHVFIGSCGEQTNNIRNFEGRFNVSLHFTYTQTHMQRYHTIFGSVASSLLICSFDLQINKK